MPDATSPSSTRLTIRRPIATLVPQVIRPCVPSRRLPRSWSMGRSGAVLLAALSLCATMASAQTAGGARPPARRGAAPATSPAANGGATAPALLGTWNGTATIPLKDSSIVVPVVYTFTQSGATVAGTAMVPGQGTGPISDVVRSGTRLTFRVTAPEGRILEHDGAMTADGAIEGMVHLDKQPVAKFRITPRKGDATTR